MPSDLKTVEPQSSKYLAHQGASSHKGRRNRRSKKGWSFQRSHRTKEEKWKEKSEPHSRCVLSQHLCLHYQTTTTKLSCVHFEINSIFLKKRYDQGMANTCTGLDFSHVFPRIMVTVSPLDFSDIVWSINYPLHAAPPFTHTQHTRIHVHAHAYTEMKFPTME